MAKKEETSKIILERSYVIPLRRDTLKSPPHKKAKKAVRAVREFITQHMKPTDIKIGRYLNLKLWEHGIKNPPNKIKVITTKDDKGKVFVELADAPKEQPKADEKKTAPKKDGKVVKEAEFKAKPEGKIEKEVEQAKEEKAEEAKKIEQEEIKELQKEHPKHHAPKIPQKSKMQDVHPTAPKSV